MKKYIILLIGLSVMAFGGFYLSLTGCNMPQLKYVGNKPPENAPDIAADLVYGYKLIHVGELFPDIALKAPGNQQDRSYLGLGLTSDATFSIKDIQADLVLVEMLNVHCVPCREQAPVYNNLFELIEAGASSKDRIKMLAVGVGNNEEEIKYFREKYKIPFPVIADQRLELHEAIGEPHSPFSVLVRLKKDSDVAMVALTYSKITEKYEVLYQDMMALKTLNFAVFRERGVQTKTTVNTIAPPQPQSEIVAQIKDAMTKVSDSDDNFTEFRKLSIEGRHVYTGVKEDRKGSKRLFAEVISRPSICNVCHDVHFFYIFNKKGAVLEFVPLQVTKWGNKEWSKEDVQLMRERLVGRFIFTPFYFNPQLDAVTSATISSVVIFDGLSQGKQLFEFLKQKGLVL